MADLEYRKLDGDEIRRELDTLPEWSIVDGQISRTFKFQTYKEGLVFATAVGYLADKLDHHPDLHIGYAKVRVSMNTHAVHGLSPYDFELARRIDTTL